MKLDGGKTFPPLLNSRYIQSFLEENSSIPPRVETLEIAISSREERRKWILFCCLLQCIACNICFWEMNFLSFFTQHWWCTLCVGEGERGAIDENEIRNEMHGKVLTWEKLLLSSLLWCKGEKDFLHTQKQPQKKNENLCWKWTFFFFLTAFFLFFVVAKLKTLLSDCFQS